MPTFANTINDNQILAKRSQCDYAGNDIQTTYATKTEVTTGLAAKQDTISDLSTIRSGAQAGATAVQPGSLSTVATSGSYNDLSNRPTIPTVDQAYNASSTNAQSGTAVAGAISGINQVPASTSSDADKVLTVNAQGTPAWASAQAPITAGNGIDITNNVVSVDTSVVATQTDLADKEDAFDVGTGLEMDTSGATPTLQVEAPVDIVAGPGIVIDNPDGNTLRVSTDENYEKELYVNTTVPYTNVDDVFTLTEPVTNFERIRVETWNREFQQYQATYEFTIAGSTTSTVFVMSMDNSESTSNIQRLNMRFSYNSAGNLVDKGHVLFFGNGSSTANGPQRGLGIHRVVGIHRIQGGN